MNEYGGRKFLLCLLTFVTCSGLLVFNHIDAGTFKDIVIATVAVYVAGNVSQKAFSEKGKQT